MFCPACGAPNESASRYCVKCGRALPVTSPSESVADTQIRVQPQSRRASWLLLVAGGLLLLVVAVLAAPRLLSAIGVVEGPERVAQLYLEALWTGDRDKAEAVTCSTWQGWEDDDWGWSLPEDVQIDTSRLRYSVVQGKQNTAFVKVSGKYRILSGGEAYDSEEIDGAVFVVHEWFQWRVCDWPSE